MAGARRCPRVLARAFVALLLVVPLAGCLGSADGPGIPQSALAAKQWGRDGEPSVKTLYGLAEVRQQAYGPGGQGTFGGALVVSVTDVPLVDEAKYVPDQLEAYQRSQGITLTKRGTESLALANLGQSVTADLYDVETAAPGVSAARAIIVQVRCEDPDTFVVAVGYGATGTSGGLLGGGTLDVYAQSRDLVQALACRA